MSVSDDDTDCSACNIHSDILTQCDKCLKWFCDHCHGLTPDIVKLMPSLSDAGLFWFCRPCHAKPFSPELPTTTETISTQTQTTTETISTQTQTLATIHIPSPTLTDTTT